MRKFFIPHTAKWMAVCIGFICGSLIFQGCGGDDAQQKKNPYAELDEAYPEGSSLFADVAERTQDKEYMAKIQAEIEKKSLLSAEVAKTEATMMHYRNEVKANLERKLGAEVQDVVLEEKLAKHALYQEALQKYNAAVEAMQAQQQATMNLIRERMTQPEREYKAKLAEADAKAKAMGLPTRAEEAARLQAEAALAKSATATEAPAASEQAQPKAVPTVEELAKQTGIPIAPAAETNP